MSTIQEFEAAAAKATQASAQADTWANGPINTTVPTDSGPVPTIAEFTRANQERADAAIDALGWVLAGDFTAGCTVTERNQYVLVVGGAGYRWDGVLPKVVAPGSAPTPIATGAWVLVGDVKLRGDLAAASGSDIVGFQQAGAGSVPRTSQDKMRELITPMDFGAVGDGVTDDTAALQAAFNAAVGKCLLLGSGKEYGITSIIIPDGVTLISNNSTFKKLTGSAAYGITISGNGVKIDALNFSSVGGATDKGIRISGNNTSIGHLSISSDAIDSDIGLYISRSTSDINDRVTNTRLGFVSIDNYLAACLIYNVKKFNADSISTSGHRTGIYVRDGSDVAINGGVADSISASATGAPGQNSILIESVIAANSTDGVFISNYISKISAEHGFRVGGSLVANNIHFTNCHAINAGYGTTVGVGGAGIKILGPNPESHTNIFVTDCSAEDLSQWYGDNNNGFDFSFIDGGCAANLIVRKRTNTYSAPYGLRLSQLKNFTISNPNVSDVGVNAIRFIELTDASVTNVAMENVALSGGIVGIAAGVANDVINMNCKYTTYRNLTISGLQTYNGRAATRIEMPLGAGAYSAVSVDLTYLYSSQATPIALTGAAADQITCNVRGIWTGSGSTAKNGSIFQDLTAGVVRIRKAGSWVAL